MLPWHIHMPSVLQGLFSNYSLSLTYKLTNAVRLDPGKQVREWRDGRNGNFCRSWAWGARGGGHWLLGGLQLCSAFPFPLPFPPLWGRVTFFICGSCCTLMSHFKNRDTANSSQNQTFVNWNLSAGEAKHQLFLLQAECNWGTFWSWAWACLVL